MGTTAAQRLGQHYAYAAMQKAIGLARMFVHGDAGFDTVVANFQELHPQVFTRGLFMAFLQNLNADRFFPDIHGAMVQRTQIIC